MDNEIIAYREMCNREESQLQKGMNFRLRPSHSVVLMSMRPNAPYADRVEDDGRTLIYEGHNQPRSVSCRSPELVDQPARTTTGRPTENGKFDQAAQAFKSGRAPAERVRVYEKIHKGVWSYNGLFHLEDSWTEDRGGRKVWKFRLRLVDEITDGGEATAPLTHNPGRVIPSSVKLEVWRRDGGKCAQCGSETDLHFDHIIPYSRGGSSTKAENIQLLCSAHNLAKSDRIE